MIRSAGAFPNAETARNLADSWQTLHRLYERPGWEDRDDGSFSGGDLQLHGRSDRVQPFPDGDTGLDARTGGPRDAADAVASSACDLSRRPRRKARNLRGAKFRLRCGSSARRWSRAAGDRSRHASERGFAVSRCNRRIRSCCDARGACRPRRAAKRDCSGSGRRFCRRRRWSGHRQRVAPHRTARATASDWNSCAGDHARAELLVVDGAQWRRHRVGGFWRRPFRARDRCHSRVTATFCGDDPGRRTR
jgi:hypothetical protein